MRIYQLPLNPNGTGDLVITRDDGTVIDYIAEAIFGDCSYSRWEGDALKGITVLYYGESIGYLEYTDAEYLPIVRGEYSDITQVIEVSLREVLSRIAVNPMNDGSETVEHLRTLVRGNQ